MEAYSIRIGTTDTDVRQGTDVRPDTDVRQGPSLPGLSSPNGDRISVSRSSLERNGKPWFGISGEFHFSRYDERYWRDELIKIRMGGVNVVSTYVFWNFHEEIRGEFDWTGRKNLRAFVGLCGSLGLFVIARIGPWCHGEVRNGGFPDWLYGQPWELRSNDPGYLERVAILYGQIGMQLSGLLFKDGGPVIGVQLENEHMHAGAPWEMTTGISDEWQTSGRDGGAHILKLKELARSAGLEVPLYTATAWGGASAPVPEVLPLWGGYAFQPWIFYGDAVEHPATPEYIFRNYRSNAVPKTYNFEPSYKPEDYPYACCEMGGGMECFYRYRFVLEPESVEAMALVKTAGGCNFLGYYLYHGGTNPRGRLTPFLNEHAVPRLSYGYQAPLGEFGRPRGQYAMLKPIHFFLHDFGEKLCPMTTSLPEGAEDGGPTDFSRLRFACRSSGASGFLFVCNYQDHAEARPHAGVSVSLEKVDGAVLRVPREGGFSVGRNVSFMLPFGFDLEGLELEYATVQPVSRIEAEGEPWFVFFKPEGVEAELAFASAERVVIETLEGLVDPSSGGAGVVRLPGAGTAAFRATGADRGHRGILVLSRVDALELWMIGSGKDRRLVISSSVVLEDGPDVRFEHEGNGEVGARVFPPLPSSAALGKAVARTGREGLWEAFRVRPEARSLSLGIERRSSRVALVSVEPGSLEGLKQAFLLVDYSGDIGNAYIGDELVADDFSNGAPWEIELTRHRRALASGPLCIKVTPLRAASRVVSDTPMAGRSEIASGESGEIREITSLVSRDVPFFSRTADPGAGSRSRVP
jgi:hypothetical protein